MNIYKRLFGKPEQYREPASENKFYNRAKRAGIYRQPPRERTAARVATYIGSEDRNRRLPQVDRHVRALARETRRLARKAQKLQSRVR